MSRCRLLSEWRFGLQERLCPAIEETIRSLAAATSRSSRYWSSSRVERFLPHFIGLPWRAGEYRAAGARSLHHDPRLDRAASGWASTIRCVVCAAATRVHEIPSKATFSRAFSAFAHSALPSHLHEALTEQRSGRSADRGSLTRLDVDRGRRETDAEATAAGPAEAQARTPHTPPAAQRRATAAEGAARRLGAGRR